MSKLYIHYNTLKGGVNGKKYPCFCFLKAAKIYPNHMETKTNGHDLTSFLLELKDFIDTLLTRYKPFTGKLSG